MRVPTPLSSDLWPVVPAKFLFERARRLPRDRDGVVTAFRDGEVTLRSNRRTEGFTNAVQEHGYQGVRRGDLVIHSMDGFAGAIGVSDSDGKASPVVHCYTPVKGVDSRFYAYFLRNLAQCDFITSLAKGIRERSTAFDGESFRSLLLPAPSPNEQRAIADFLDAETARINALITKKRRLVELVLARMRGRVREVTRRGHVRSSRQRDSGLPWVGTIPLHWRVVPLRSMLEIRRNPVGLKHKEVVLLSLTRGGVIVRDVSENYGKFPASFDTYQRVSPGEIVFCLFDIPETPRTVGLARHEGMVTGAYSVFRVNGASAPFLTYLYEGFDDEKSLSFWYTGLRNVIRPDVFLGMKCPLPPRVEQDEIVEVLDEERTLVVSLVSRLQKQTALLQEHRAALIAAAVTGELDVPGVAA